MKYKFVNADFTNMCLHHRLKYNRKSQSKYFKTMKSTFD